MRAYVRASACPWVGNEPRPMLLSHSSELDHHNVGAPLSLTLFLADSGEKEGTRGRGKKEAGEVGEQP